MSKPFLSDTCCFAVPYFFFFLAGAAGFAFAFAMHSPSSIATSYGLQ